MIRHSNVDGAVRTAFGIELPYLHVRYVTGIEGKADSK